MLIGGLHVNLQQHGHRTVLEAVVLRQDLDLLERLDVVADGTGHAKDPASPQRQARKAEGDDGQGSQHVQVHPFSRAVVRSHEARAMEPMAHHPARPGLRQSQ